MVCGSTKQQEYDLDLYGSNAELGVLFYAHCTVLVIQ